MEEKAVDPFGEVGEKLECGSVVVEDNMLDEQSLRLYVTGKGIRADTLSLTHRPKEVYAYVLVR